MEIDFMQTMKDFGKPRTATKLKIKKFNRNDKMCYFDEVDLTGEGFNEAQLAIISKLFLSAGFKTEVKNITYFGIYDPSRMVELIELYPTDEELDRKERAYAQIENKSFFGQIF